MFETKQQGHYHRIEAGAGSSPHPGSRLGHLQGLKGCGTKVLSTLLLTFGQFFRWNLLPACPMPCGARFPDCSSTGTWWGPWLGILGAGTWSSWGMWSMV